MHSAANTPSETPSHPQRIGVRGVILGWCLWLLGSWACTLWIGTGGLGAMDAGTSGSWTGVRWMTLVSMVGLLLVWPAFRLSERDVPVVSEQDAEDAGAGGGTSGGGRFAWVLGDWLALNVVFQAVVWPLQLIAGWGVVQAVWLIAAVGAWSGLVSVAVAWGRWQGSGPARSLAMGVCVAVVVGEPVAWVLLGWGDGVSWLAGPLSVLWSVSAEPVSFDASRHGGAVLATGLAAVVGWCVLGLMARLAGRAGRR